MVKKPPADKVTAEKLRIQGNYFVNKNEFEKGIKKYKESIRANPSDLVNEAKCHIQMANAYSTGMGDSRLAAVHIDKATALVDEAEALLVEVDEVWKWDQLGILLGILLFIVWVFQRFKCKKKKDDERKLHKKKQDEEINEARNKKILSEKKQEGERKEAKLKKELQEKMPEDRSREAKLKKELEDKKQEDERKERKLRKELEEKKKLDEQETSREGLMEKLNNVSVEIKSFPRPDAVCRWEKCEQVQSPGQINPSKNIYVSDPDFKGYYKVCCRTNCQVSYHKSCWLSVKEENSDEFKLGKCPTEKYFLGQSCFTPDCGDNIVKIEIIDDSGEIRTIKDDKMMEQLLVDERKRREESQIKRKRKNDEERFKVYEKQIKKRSEKIKSKKNSPFSLASVSPNPISSTSSVSFAREVSHFPQVITRPFPTPPLGYKGNLPPFSGNPEARVSVPVLPKIYPRSGITSQDSFKSPTSQSTFSPTSFSAQSFPVPQLEVTQFGVDVLNHKKASQAGSSPNYPSTEATSTGATATFLTSSRPTSTGDNSKTDQPGAKTGKQYDNLVAQLQKNHPSLGQDQARAYVMELRLSGMKRHDILNKVASFVQRDRGIVDDASFMQGDRGNVDGPSFMQRDEAIVNVAGEEDKNCSVCLEDMLDSDSVYLNPCRHRFHTDCINQWLDSPGGAGSTCPMCRNYIIKEKDFPSLGESFRRF